MATSLNSTTLSAAITTNQNTIPVASATNLSAPISGFYQQVYVIGPGQPRGELMNVLAVSGTQISVARLSEYKSAFPSGALVLIGPAPTANPVFSPFQTYDPVGSSASNNSNSASDVQATPWVNVITGAQWLFSSVLNCWVPGFNNPLPPAVTSAVASLAGVTTVSGPLFHITGTNAITGFTLPVGFTSGSFTVIPDGVFTWTAATNIALAGTAVVNKALTFTWDGTNSKWVPSYIA